MSKKITAIVLEVIPIISAILSFIFVVIPYGSGFISRIIPILFLFAFLGFLFFFMGKKLCRENKIVKVLGILDLIATIYVIVFYVIAIFNFGL